MTSVLVVEDDQLFARAVGRDLGEQGFDVSIVHTASDALVTLSTLAIDVLLTDLQLGAQDGIDLLDSLREVSPRTRAVLMSGFATARDYQRAVELGAVRVLCKPFTPAELNQCIRQAVECETGFRGSVHGLSLVDMLQMFHYARRSVTITVAARVPGRIHLDEGQIVHVEHDGRAGEEALLSILALPAGTLSTTALAAGTQRTVTRDFREVLLDALRALDESQAPSAVEADLDLAFLDEPAAAAPDDDAEAPRGAPYLTMLERLRDIDGYLAACLVMSSSGGVLGHDGRLDLRPAAAFTAEIVRRNDQLLRDLGLDDETEDVLVTSPTEYHLVRALRSDVPAFVYVVLDRSLANPAMARRALAHTVRSFDL